MNKKNITDLSALLGGARKPESAGAPTTMTYVTTAAVPANLGNMATAESATAPVSEAAYLNEVPPLSEATSVVTPGRKKREARRPSPNPTERWTRATFVIREQYNDDLRDLAWYKRVTIKELLDEALNVYLHEHEAELKAARRERKKSGGENG